MDVPVPFKPFTKHRYLSSGEVRRRSERATAAAIGGLLTSTEYEQWTKRKSRRRAAAWAAASLLLGLLVGWLAADSWPAVPTTTLSDLSHVFDILSIAAAPEDAIAAAIDHVRVLKQDAVALRSEVTAITETSQKLSSRLAAAETSSAEDKHTAQQQQRELHDYRASVTDMQQRSILMQEQLGDCKAKVAKVVQELEAAMYAQRSAVLAANEQEEAVTVAISAQTDCAAYLKISQGEVRKCVADLALSQQTSVEASSRAATCESELRKAFRELDYALSDSEALVARSRASRLQAALSVAAGLALAVLLTTAYMYTSKRKITSLQLEREKLLLDKLEAEAGSGSMRGRSIRAESRRLHD